MKILVTGASGFIGKHLTSVLENNLDIDLLCASRCSIENIKNVFIHGDLNHVDWSKALLGVDCVIHLAGLAHKSDYTANDYNEVNFNATARLVDAAVEFGVKRFIFISSMSVYAPISTKKHLNLFSPLLPNTDYGKSKLAAEEYLLRSSKEKRIETVILRPTLVYGKNAPGNFGLLTSLVFKVPILPFGLTYNKRSFISVQNLVDLISTCVIHPNAGNHIFLASECKTVSIKHFTSSIAKGIGKKRTQLPVPIWLMRFVGKILGKSSMIEQLVGNLEVDSSQLQDVLGWVQPYTMEESMSFLKQEKINRIFYND